MRARSFKHVYRDRSAAWAIRASRKPPPHTALRKKRVKQRQQISHKPPFDPTLRLAIRYATGSVDLAHINAEGLGLAYLLTCCPPSSAALDLASGACRCLARAGGNASRADQKKRHRQFTTSLGVCTVHAPSSALNPRGRLTRACPPFAG